MISIGTSITAAGAIKYFKNDLENQTSEEDDLAIIGGITSNIKRNANNNSKPSDDDDSSGTSGFILSGTFALWQGELAEEFGLQGKVTQKEFNRLCRGQHLHTGEQLIRHVKPRTKIKPSGKEYQTKIHRAGLDQTINAPKSVSLVAMKDARVINAHLGASFIAIKIAEEFTKAKKGNINPPEKTGKSLYASFLHFDARPDNKNGLVSPTMHCHFFQFNITKTADGKYRALEMRENYRSQKLVTAVYRSELHRNMTLLGYKMQVDDKTKAPEVIGISRDFIDANSPRQNEIIEKAQELKIKSTKTVAANYRKRKKSDKSEMIRRFNDLEKKFGFQSIIVARTAKKQADKTKLSDKQTADFKNKNIASANGVKKAAEAMDFAVGEARKNKTLEKNKRKFVTQQSLMADALNFALKETTIHEVKAEFSKRYQRGDLDEFDLDRKNKYVKKTGSIISDQTQKIKEINIKETSNEKPERKEFTAASPVRLDVADDSKIPVEPYYIREQRNTYDSQSAEYFTDNYNHPINSNFPSGNSFIEEIGKSDVEKSDFNKKVSAVDHATENRPAKSFGKVENTGKQTSEPERNGSNAQPNRSGKKIKPNDSANGRNKKENRFADNQSELGTQEKSDRDKKSFITNKQSQVGESHGTDRSSGGEREIEKGTVGISDIRQLVKKYQKGSLARLENRQSSDFRKTNFDKQSFVGRLNDLVSGTHEIKIEDSFDTGSNRESQKGSRVEAMDNGAQLEMDGNHIEAGNPLNTADYSDNVLPFNDSSGFEKESGAGKSEKRGTGKAELSANTGEKQNKPGLFDNSNNTQRNFSERRKILQTETGTAGKIDSKTDEETNRATATKTAQIINIKYYNGQLDEKIVKEWTIAIERVSADQFLSELLESSKVEDRQKKVALLDKQAEIFADKLNLPKPELQNKQNEKLIAVKLTEIQAQNYEDNTGEKINIKTFEILSEENSLLSDTPPSDVNKKEIEEIFGGLPLTPKFVSDLESQTFIALLYPESVGFDEELINRTQEMVRKNEIASSETVTLVQIAFGGQADVFTDNFKTVLADEIYYDYESPNELYNYVRQSDWQNTIKIFAPIIQNLSEQNDSNLVIPGSEQERNKFLIDFNSLQIIEAYESQNKTLNDGIKACLVNEYSKLGNLESIKKQNDFIENHFAGKSLDAPEFKSSLEAESYKLINEEETEKKERSERIVNHFEAENEKEIQNQEIQELEFDRGMSM